MDRRASEIIGLPIITFGKGNKIYNAEDLLIEPERKQVLALLVTEWSLFKPAKAIPFGRVQAIGPDAIVVPDSRAVIDISRDPVLKKLYDKQIVRGLRVITEGGRKLGEISDILLDSKTGEIRGFYVSVGKVLSVTQGLRWLPAENVSTIGQRVLYVPDQIADDFETQSGGWSGALDQAGDKLRAVGSKANERLAELGSKAQDSGAKLNQQLTQAGDQMRDTLPKQAGTLVIGRTAHRTVTAGDGTPIVQQGNVITDDHVETARKEDRLSQLLMAAGVGPMQQHGGNLGSQANQSIADMRTEARDLWTQLTGGYARSVDQADEKLMQKRVKRALGRPTTRVILDKSDNVILNTGDIITNRAIEAAKEADVLDVLVDSVYTERPTLSLEDLKAPRSGRASLKNDVITTSAIEAPSSVQPKLLESRATGAESGTPPGGRARRAKGESAASLPTEQP